MKIRRFFERLFLIAGIVMLAIWAGSEMRYIIWQDWGEWVFDRELKRQPVTAIDYLKDKKTQLIAAGRRWLRLPAATNPEAVEKSAPNVPPSPPAASRPEHDSLIGRLIIPRLHLSATVREGADEEVLAVALGHIPGTSLPGHDGNVAIAGHRDKLFRGLREIRPNDLIEVQTLSGDFTYQVESTQIVQPTDVSVLNAAAYSELTLVTCYPFFYVGAAPDRFIVKARQVSRPPQEAPAVTQLAAAEVPSPVARPAASTGETQPSRGPNRILFQIPKDHSRQLAAGVWFGVTSTDVTSHLVNGWMWLMPDRRTIWIRNQNADEPVVFYSIRDGKRRELRMTNISNTAVSGYLSSAE